MQYDELQKLLDPSQFLQMQLVRQHLMQDPTSLDSRPRGGQKDAYEEALSLRQEVR